MRQIIWYLALLMLFPLVRSQAKVIRSFGTFAIDTTSEQSVVDPNSGPLIPERQHPSAAIRVRIHINSTFSLQALTSLGCKVLNQTGTSVFLQCKASLIDQIAALPGVERLTVSRALTPHLDSARGQSGLNFVHGTAPSSPLPLPYTGKGVLCGIVDIEFDTHHPAFIDSTGKTRFIALWDQHDSTGANKNRFGYGTIKDQAGLHADPTFAMVEGNHGTHTASTMAGSDWKSGYVGAAPGSMIAAVRYGGSEELPDAISWIFSLADSLKVPCVINLSLGLPYGPHDGTSAIDRLIDSLSGPGRIIVGAIGNDGAIPSHIKFTLAPKDTGRTWIWPTKDTLNDTLIVKSGVDLWGEQGNFFNVMLFVQDNPTGRYLTSTTSISTSRLLTSGTDSIVWKDTLLGTVSIRYNWGWERSAPSNKKPHLSLTTLTHHPRLVLGVGIINNSTSSTVIHGWNLTRQIFHHFNTPGFSQGDSLYSVNEVGGTSKRSITVGGYIGRLAIPLWDSGPKVILDDLVLGNSFYTSSIGPTVDGRIKPDLCAPAWTVVAAVSRMVPRDYPMIILWPDTSTTSGRYGAQTGTSMSAPFVAGIVAIMLEANPKLTPEEAKKILQESAITDAFTGPLQAYSNKWGAGKINALGAMLQLLDIKVQQISREKGRTLPLVQRIGRKISLVSSPYRDTRISVYDMVGRRVFAQPIEPGQSVVLPATIADGWYIARVSTGEAHIDIPVMLFQQ